MTNNFPVKNSSKCAAYEKRSNPEVGKVKSFAMQSSKASIKNGDADSRKSGGKFLNSNYGKDD
jgi:hypothetical protein